MMDRETVVRKGKRTKRRRSMSVVNVAESANTGNICGGMKRSILMIMMNSLSVHVVKISLGKTISNDIYVYVREEN